MDEDVRIVYLWAEITGYVISVLEALSKDYSASINAVHWDARNENSTSYKIKESGNINFYPRSQYNRDRILELLNDTKPHIVVVSAWEDKDYIWASRLHKKKCPDVKIVAGIDDQWHGTFRQRLGTIFYKYFYRSVFDFMWVSGSEQFNFARAFGYDQKNIIQNLYSGTFSKEQLVPVFTKRFVFCGRLLRSKGVDLIIKAHKGLPEPLRSNWPLVIIGSGGDMMTLVDNNDDQHIKHISFLQPEDLYYELSKGGIGCMPSRKEQWGVVIHEYTQIGMPLLLSNICGAANELLIPGFNGYKFEAGCLESLSVAMKKFTSLTQKQYESMAKNSFLLSSKINPERCAASILSILE
jgi:glycosyltransferase involved in cell wall biosynthesis